MNRIKELRLERKKQQKEVANDLSIPVSTYAGYERNEREPKLETWQKLADYFGVDVGYLQGISNDRDGYDLWEDATGYTKEQIQKGLEELNANGVLSGDLQSDIGFVVDTKDGRASGFGDRPALRYVENALQSIQSTTEKKYYLDQTKLNNISDDLKIGNNNFLRSSENNFGEDYFYNGVNPKVLRIVQGTIIDARRIISIAGNAVLNDVPYEQTILDEVINHLVEMLKEQLDEDMQDNLNDDEG